MRLQKLSVSTSFLPTSPVRQLRFLLAVVLVFGSAVPSLQTLGQARGETLVFPASIQWPRQRGVTWYRLQIGGDEAFRDIYQDRRVLGDKARISDLDPGYYYWRIAPADDQLGEFSRPVRFFLSGGVVTWPTIRSGVVRGSFPRPAP